MDAVHSLLRSKVIRVLHLCSNSSPCSSLPCPFLQKGRNNLVRLFLQCQLSQAAALSLLFLGLLLCLLRPFHHLVRMHPSSFLLLCLLFFHLLSPLEGRISPSLFLGTTIEMLEFVSCNLFSQSVNASLIRFPAFELLSARMGIGEVRLEVNLERRRWIVVFVKVGVVNVVEIFSLFWYWREWLRR